MEVDVPSMHENGCLPVLDLGLSVNNNKIKTSFYSKPMSSPYQIHYISGQPFQAEPNVTPCSKNVSEGSEIQVPMSQTWKYRVYFQNT